MVCTEKEQIELLVSHKRKELADLERKLVELNKPEFSSLVFTVVNNGDFVSLCVNGDPVMHIYGDGRASFLTICDEDARARLGDRLRLK